MTKQKVAREITVLVRYTVKATGNVVLYVKNDKGDRYYVTLQSNGATSCNCVATRKCYHIAKCSEMEAARKEVAQQFAAKSVPTWAMQLVTAGKLVAPKQVVQLPADIAPINGTLRVKGPAIERSNLNGAQQSAGLLMELPSRKKLAS